MLHVGEQRITSSGRPIRQWVCQCSCGNKVKVDTTKLTSGRARSCGCGRALALGGTRFDCLEVIERVASKSTAPNTFKRVFWRCVCDCGNSCVTTTSELLSGRKRHCGCIKARGRHKNKRKVRPAAERFWALVDKKQPEDCWNWRGGTSGNGYGRFRKGRALEGMIPAHVFAYELENGAMPKGMLGLHKCDNRGCCNPAHIFPGTSKDNAQDCLAKGRHTSLFRNYYDERRNRTRLRMGKRKSPQAVRKNCFKRWSFGEPNAVRLQCYLCSRVFDPTLESWHADHVVPWANDGADDPENVRPACIPCHKGKTSIDVEMMAKGKRIRSKHLGVSISKNPMQGSRASQYAKRYDRETGRWKAVRRSEDER